MRFPSTSFFRPPLFPRGWRRLAHTACWALAATFPASVHDTRLVDVRAVDEQVLMVHFKDGEVRYRDDGTGPSAFAGGHLPVLGLGGGPKPIAPGSAARGQRKSPRIPSA